MYVRYRKQNNLESEVVVVGKFMINHAVVYTSKSSREIRS